MLMTKLLRAAKQIVLQFLIVMTSRAKTDVFIILERAIKLVSSIGEQRKSFHCRDIDEVAVCTQK
jgi:hypothetical protein